MNPRYPGIAARAGHRCEYCRAPEAIFNLPFEIEHVRPIGDGGMDEVSNLALACRGCNLHKSNAVTAFDSVTDQRARLFDPRRDSWDEHFCLEMETLSIPGISRRLVEQRLSSCG